MLAASCSVLLDSDQVQCKQTSDCTALDPRFEGGACVDSYCVEDPRWSCLGQVPTPPPTTQSFKVPLKVQNIVTQMPLPDVKVRICRRLDVDCKNSVVPEAVTDANGTVTFSLQGGFNGYAYLEGADLAPGLYFFNPPIRTDLDPISISMGAFVTTSLLALQAGVTQDPGRAVILIDVRDCTGAAAAGVTFEASGTDDAAAPFYSEKGLPSGAATETDKDGYGGLLNVAPGSVSFAGVLTASGRRVGEISLLAREGSMTYGRIVPDGS